MAFTCGFYNSLNGDRKYDAIQLSSIFDGVLKDGVYLNYGDAFAVTSTGGLGLMVGTGRAWFNHTWSLNDSGYPITLEASEALLNRIDTVILEVNTNAGVRNNVLRVLKSAPNSVYANIHSPVVPVNGGVYQYRLAEIKRDAGSTSITQANITNFVGSANTPYVSGLIQTFTTEALTAQFEARFETWFSDLESTMDGNVEANLNNKINALQAEVDSMDTRLTGTDTGWVNASFYTPNGYSQISSPDKLQWRKINNTVHIRGACQKTVSGTGSLGNGIMVNMPVSPQTQLVGHAQAQAGGYANLVILQGESEVYADSAGATGTFNVGWLRLRGSYDITPW